MEESDFNKDEIRKNILANKHNNVTTCYYLLLKIKTRRGLASASDLISKDFTQYLENPKSLKANRKKTDLYLPKDENQNTDDFNFTQQNITEAIEKVPIKNNNDLIQKQITNNLKNSNNHNHNNYLNSTNKSIEHNQTDTDNNSKTDPLKNENNKAFIENNKNIMNNTTNIYINNLTYLNALSVNSVNKIDEFVFKNVNLSKKNNNNLEDITAKDKKIIKNDATNKKKILISQANDYINKNKDILSIKDHFRKSFDYDLKNQINVPKSEVKINPNKPLEQSLYEINYAILTSSTNENKIKNNYLKQILSRSIDRNSSRNVSREDRNSDNSLIRENYAQNNLYKKKSDAYKLKEKTHQSSSIVNKSERETTQKIKTRRDYFYENYISIKTNSK